MEMQSFGADVLCAFALKAGGKEQLEELIKTGQVSARNIVGLLTPRALKDRKILTQIITWIGEQARENGARIVAPSQEAVVEPTATTQKRKAEPAAPKSAVVERTYDKAVQTKWSEVDITDKRMRGVEERSFLQRLMQHAILSREEELALFKHVLEGDLGARNKLVRQNMRLVMHVARRFVWSALELDDLVQEGTLGLIRAIDDFDPSRGFKLSTYAPWWIRQRITRAIMNTGGLIRVPAHLQERYGKVLRARTQLEAALKREPTPEELAAKLMWEVREVTEILAMGTFRYTNLDAEVFEEESDSQHEFISDAAAINYALFLIEAQESQREIEKRLKAVLWYLRTTSALPSRTVAMFRDRYGLQHKDAQQRTLQMVGDTYGISRERVRQIIETAWEVITPKFGMTENQLLESVRQLQELEKITGIEVALRT